MKALISVTTAGALADALEDWIIKNKCNPKSPEEWSRCISDLIAAGAVAPVASVDEKDLPAVKEQLQNDFTIKDLKDK